MSLSSSRSQWWAQETQASHQASPLDDKLDESELSAGQGHLPAFLSSRSNVRFVIQAALVIKETPKPSPVVPFSPRLTSLFP